MNDYEKTIAVNKPVTEVYSAITNHIADWWSNDLTGAAAQLHDSFTIAFGKTRKTFNILEATADKQIVWQCTKAHIANLSLENKSEWAGTKMYWTLSSNSQGTTIHFLHEGLTPAFKCYNLCEAGWDQFLGSLQAFVNTGKGRPHTKVG